MLLAIDVGNTNITIGLYKKEDLGARWRLATDNARMPDEYGLQILGLLQHCGCDLTQIEGICLASVVPPLTGRITLACQNYLGIQPFIFNHEVKTGIKILVDNPSSVGADRIVDVVAVNHLYGGPACIVDFGTATTFDVINQEGSYLGGAISPGIGIASEALVEHTAQLPRVDLNRPPSVIGRNTIHAMQSGLLFGYVSLVEGMISRIRSELSPDIKVIATGGLAEIIANETKVIEIIAPWLTLEGLRIIWELNH